jgi:hypothetical protein
MVVGTVHSTKQICSKQPGHSVHLKLEALIFVRLYTISTLPDPTDKCASLVGGISVHCVTSQAVLVDLYVFNVKNILEVLAQNS